MRSGRQPEQALETFKEMQCYCVTPNIITYHALISALEKSKRMA